MTERERRVMIVRFSLRLMLQLFNRWRLPNPQICMLSTKPPLPDDARVVGINANWGGLFIEALVYSEEFDEVPDGGEPPVWNSTPEDHFEAFDLFEKVRNDRIKELEESEKVLKNYFAQILEAYEDVDSDYEDLGAISADIATKALKPTEAEEGEGEGK